MKRNSFLTRALEELQQATSEGPVAGQDVGQVAVQDTPDNPNAPSTGPVSETNIDSTTDAVAELMEQNTQLATENSELQQEVFDNDVEIIDSISDSARTDLEEAVSAGAALEQLAYMCRLTVSSGQANTATAASLAFALEQATLRAGLASPMAALEDSTAADATPEQQTEEIGAVAKSKAAEVWQRVVASIKRIIAWLVNAMASLFDRMRPVAEKAKALEGQLEQLDKSAKIQNEAFIASLRLLDGDANKQFAQYAKSVDETLYGFFNGDFVRTMNEVAHRTNEETIQTLAKLFKVVGAVHTGIFPVSVEPELVIGKLPAVPAGSEIVAGKTEPMVGGVQLFLAYSKPFGEGAFVQAGVVKTEPKLFTGNEIPAVDKDLASAVLKQIQQWHKDQKELAAILKEIDGFGKMGSEPGTVKAAQVYLKTVAAIATSIIPQLARLNTQNSANFVRYVEKSIQASKAAGAQQ